MSAVAKEIVQQRVLVKEIVRSLVAAQMTVMGLAPMNVVQQDHLAALKVHEAQRVADSLREFGIARERRNSNFLEITPAPITSRASRMTGGMAYYALWLTVP